MKTLSKDYTTPEQSKRLLELGVPVDSADCYYDSWGQIQWRQLKDLDHDFFQKYNYYTPCWSVGRLIEIYEICFGGYFGYRYFGHTLMEDVLLKIEEQIDSIDFSRLE